MWLCFFLFANLILDKKKVFKDQVKGPDLTREPHVCLHTPILRSQLNIAFAPTPNSRWAAAGARFHFNFAAVSAVVGARVRTGPRCVPVISTTSASSGVRAGRRRRRRRTDGALERKREGETSKTEPIMESRRWMMCAERTVWHRVVSLHIRGAFCLPFISGETVRSYREEGGKGGAPCADAGERRDGLGLHRWGWTRGSMSATRRSEAAARQWTAHLTTTRQTHRSFSRRFFLNRWRRVAPRRRASERYVESLVPGQLFRRAIGNAGLCSM